MGEALLDKVKERFRQSDRLRDFLPVLEEYIFHDSVLLQLLEKSVDAVYRFCADVDE